MRRPFPKLVLPKSISVSLFQMQDHKLDLEFGVILSSNLCLVAELYVEVHWFKFILHGNFGSTNSSNSDQFPCFGALFLSHWLHSNCKVYVIGSEKGEEEDLELLEQEGW